MLATIIKLASIVQRSPEGVSWRRAWENVRKTYSSLPNQASIQSLELSAETLLSIFCTSESVEARPVMLPFLIAKHPIMQNYPNFIRELRQNAALSRQYDLLVKQFVFFSLVIGYLRSLSVGYPHGNLIFAAHHTPWTKLSNLQEIPLTIEKTLIERTNGNLLRAIGLEIRSSSSELVRALLTLASSLKEHPTFIRLDTASRNIERNKNLTRELLNSKQDFEQQVQEIIQSKEPPHRRDQRISDLAFHIYKRRGGRILEYANAFFEYEALIERIYWLLTQLMVRENVSSLSTDDRNQLQQVTLGNSVYPVLTAISKSNAKSLSIGQLVHLSISNITPNLSGLYQVEHTQDLYETGFGMRHYFKAKLLWATTLQALEDLLVNAGMQGFLSQNESILSPEGFRVQISPEQKEPFELEFGDPIINFSLSKTMYLPY